MRTVPPFLHSRFVRKEERAFSESNAVLIRVHDTLFAYGSQSGDPMVRYYNPKEGIGHCCWYYLNCLPGKGIEAFLATYGEATGRDLFRLIGNPSLRSASRNAQDLIVGLTDRTFTVSAQPYEHFLDLSGILVGPSQIPDKLRLLETVRDSLISLVVGVRFQGVFGTPTATRFQMID
jgi:hypothetical protein